MSSADKESRAPEDSSENEVRVVQTVNELEADSKLPHVASLWYELAKGPNGECPSSPVLATIKTITDKQIRAAIMEIYEVDCQVGDKDTFLKSVDSALHGNIPATSEDGSSAYDARTGERRIKWQ